MPHCQHSDPGRAAAAEWHVAPDIVQQRGARRGPVPAARSQADDRAAWHAQRPGAAVLHGVNRRAAPQALRRRARTSVFEARERNATRDGSNECRGRPRTAHAPGRATLGRCERATSRGARSAPRPPHGAARGPGHAHPAPTQSAAP